MLGHGISAPLVRLIAGLCLIASASHAFAQSQTDESGYHLKAGIGYTDNVGRTPDDAQGSVLRTAGFDVTLLKKTRSLDVDVNGDVDWLDYLDHSFKSQIVGNFTGLASVSLLPQRLLWNFADNFGQGRIDPLAASTPANRENVNYFTTGPDLLLGLTSQSHLLFSGRYSKVNYEESPADNNRVLALAGLVHDLASGSVALDVQRESIRFSDSDPTNQDYDRDQAYAHYEVSGGRTRLAADAGYSRLQRLGVSQNGIIARLELSHRLSPSSILVVATGRDNSDAANSLRLSQTLTPPSLEPQSTLQTSDPFNSTYGLLEWNFNRHRTQFGFSLTRFEEAYARLTDQDRTRTIAGVDLTRDIARSLHFTLRGTYEKDDFKHIVGDYRESGASAVLRRDFGRRLGVNLEYQYFSRGSEIPGGGYNESRGWLFVTYGREAVRSNSSVPPLPIDSAL